MLKYLEMVNPLKRVLSFGAPALLLLSGCSSSVGTTTTPTPPTAPVATLTPSALSFGSQTVDTTSSTQTLTLSNTGNASLTIASITLPGAPFTQLTNTCGTSLAAGTNCTLSYAFAPTTVDSFTATVTVTDNASGSPQSSILTGTSTAASPPTFSEVNSCTTLDTTSPAQPTPIANYAGAAFTGSVQAGSLPVIGSSVQLYSAGSTGNGTAPKALLPTPLISDANGNFSVSAKFTCPYNTSVIYVVATGGTAGPDGVANAGTILATVLGTCKSLTNGANFVVNELTTVAAATAMAPFLNPGGKMGATFTNSLGIVLAAATAANLVDINTGVGPGASFPANGIAPTARLNAIANVLDACIVSTGAASNACTQLYTATTSGIDTPANTLDAALNLARNPAANVSTLYALSTASSAFFPSVSAVPADWTTFITYSGGGMHYPASVSFDSVGNVWVTNFYNSASVFSNAGVPLLASGITGHDLNQDFGGAVDANDVEWVVDQETPSSLNGGYGAVTLLQDSGASPAVYSSGGIYFPYALAFDTSGTAWVVDYGNGHLTLLNAAGTPISGTSGYSSTTGFSFPVAIATDSKCNAWVADEDAYTVTLVTKDGSTFTDFTTGDGPDSVAVDSADNVWVANYYGDSVAENGSVGLVTNGQVISGNGYTGGGIQSPSGIAADGAGNIWVANHYDSTGETANALTELQGVAAGDPGNAISPSTGFGLDAGMLGNYGVAIDSGGSVWVSSAGGNTLVEFVGMAAPVKTPLLGPVRIP